jgi:hypothetical protein
MPPYLSSVAAASRWLVMPRGCSAHGCLLEHIVRFVKGGNILSLAINFRHPNVLDIGVQ